MISSFRDSSPGRSLQFFWSVCRFCWAGKSVRELGARHRRNLHQGGVSDIDAYPKHSTNPPHMASIARKFYSLILCARSTCREASVLSRKSPHNYAVLLSERGPKRAQLGGGESKDLWVLFDEIPMLRTRSDWANATIIGINFDSGFAAFVPYCEGIVTIQMPGGSDSCRRSVAAGSQSSPTIA